MGIKIKSLISLVISLFLLSPALGLAGLPVSMSGKNINFLYVQTAETAVLKPVNAEKGQFTLTLQDMPPYVSYFSDRPNRLVGMVSIQDFLKVWNSQNTQSFGKVPPNVTVSGIKIHHFTRNKDEFFMVELSNPQYNAKDKTLTYDALVIGKDKSLAPKEKDVLHHIILFIDTWCPGCCCG